LLLSLQVASEDEILIVSLRILVNWTEVGGSGQVSQVLLSFRAHGLRLVLIDSSRDGRDMQDRELVEKLLRLRVFKSSVTFVPASSFQEKTVDVHALLRMVDGFAFNATVLALNNLFKYIGSVLDLIE